MDKTLNQLADQAGTMHGGLANVLARLAAVEHRLTDLRADTEHVTSGTVGDALLAATDDLAQLADYVADLRARTAPAGQPSPDGEEQDESPAQPPTAAQWATLTRALLDAAG